MYSGFQFKVYDETVFTAILTSDKNDYNISWVYAGATQYSSRAFSVDQVKQYINNGSWHVVGLVE